MRLMNAEYLLNELSNVFLSENRGTFKVIILHVIITIYEIDK